MVIRNVSLILFLLIAFFKATAFAAESSSPEIFINIETDDDSVYEGQAVPVYVNLYTTDKDVAFAENRGTLMLKKGSFNSVRKVERSTGFSKKKYDGKYYFCYTLATYIVTFDNKGSYDMEDGPYEIGISVPEIIYDPFWGPVRSNQIESKEIEVKSCRIKVKSLPKEPSEMKFNGSVGVFSIETIVPKGNIYIDEEATAYIIIRGEGIIGESTLPVYKDAFKDGIKLKSFSESRSHVFNKGKLIDELQLECIFIPSESENVEIGEVKFEFFDPIEGKYKTITSKPVKITVKSSVDKREKIPV